MKNSVDFLASSESLEVNLKMESARKNSKRQPYSKADMTAAVELVKTGTVKAWSAAKSFQLPVSSLLNRLNDAHNGKVGAKTILSREEEAAMVEWIKEWAEMGQPMSKEQILNAAKQIAQSHNKDERRFDDAGKDER